MYPCTLTLLVWSHMVRTSFARAFRIAYHVVLCGLPARLLAQATAICVEKGSPVMYQGSPVFVGEWPSVVPLRDGVALFSANALQWMTPTAMIDTTRIPRGTAADSLAFLQRYLSFGVIVHDDGTATLIPRPPALVGRAAYLSAAQGDSGVVHAVWAMAVPGDTLPHYDGRPRLPRTLWAADYTNGTWSPARKIFETYDMRWYPGSLTTFVTNDKGEPTLLVVATDSTGENADRDHYYTGAVLTRAKTRMRTTRTGKGTLSRQIPDTDWYARWIRATPLGYPGITLDRKGQPVIVTTLGTTSQREANAVVTPNRRLDYSSFGQKTTEGRGNSHRIPLERCCHRERATATVPAFTSA